MGSFDFSRKEPLLYSPPDTTSEDYIFIEFFCLVSIERWGLNKSSKVYIRFNAPELGTFDSCHGPMSLAPRFVVDMHSHCNTLNATINKMVL